MVILATLTATNGAYGATHLHSGDIAINPKACPAAAEVATALHVKVLSSSRTYLPKPKLGTYSNTSCNYLTNLDNRADTGPAGEYASEVVIDYSWPNMIGDMKEVRLGLIPPITNIPHLGDDAFGQVKYHVIYAHVGSVVMKFSTPETPFPIMVKFAKKFF